MQRDMLLLRDECALCKRVLSSAYLRRCFRCGRLYCIDCSMFTKDGYVVCLNCARRMVSPPRLGTKYSPLSRYLLRRGKFTDRVVLPIGEIEGIIGNNLPISASRDSEWWNNTRSTAQGRSWIDIGWSTESVDMNKRTVTFIRTAKPQPRQIDKTKKKQTEFFKRPLRHVRQKRPLFPSRTRIAQVQARLKNIERQKATGQIQRARLPSKSAYQKRLFKPEAKPSKNVD